jgi:CheY-like chemotaxis protein
MFVWPVVALVAILLAVRVLGARDGARFDTPDAVRRLIGEEHPDLSLMDVSLGMDGASALATTREGPVVAAYVAGNQLSSRVVHSADIRHVHQDMVGGNRRLTLDLHDFGCPRITIVLGADAARGWWERLQALQHPRHLQPH